MNGETPMCCWTCGYHKKLERWDYANVRKQGVPKIDEGYVCTAFSYDGVIIQMVGHNDDTGYCECWTEATEEEMERKQIVRCRYCEHSDSDKNGDLKCRKDVMNGKPMFWCQFGERRKDNATD